MTLSHELGHAVMHEGSPKHRGVDASGTTHLSRLAPSESAEHQAKVFAAAFLIHDEMAESLPSPEEISVEFGVSLEAAKICFSEIRKKVDRRESGKRVRQIAEAFRNSSPPPFGQGPKYVDGLCERCKKPRLIPLGSKYYCTECKTTSDRFQDGDY
jgi:Zn-dependent peptidase ImmA (M78 family)